MGKKCGRKIEQISKDIQEQEREMKVKESKFLRKLREVARKPGDKPKYLWGKKEKRRGELERIRRFIQGSETRAC